MKRLNLGARKNGASGAEFSLPESFLERGALAFDAGIWTYILLFFVVSSPVGVLAGLGVGAAAGLAHYWLVGG